jgi:hypothetical protein
VNKTSRPRIGHRGLESGRFRDATTELRPQRPNRKASAVGELQQSNGQVRRCVRRGKGTEAFAHLQPTFAVSDKRS